MGGGSPWGGTDYGSNYRDEVPTSHARDESMKNIKDIAIETATEARLEKEAKAEQLRREEAERAKEAAKRHQEYVFQRRKDILEELPHKIKSAINTNYDRVYLNEVDYEICKAEGLPVDCQYYTAGGSRVEGTDHPAGFTYWLDVTKL